MNLETALENFKKALESGRLPHAIIVSGSEKKEGGEFAVKAASSLFCEAKSKPCGKCKQCDLTAKRTHPDIIWIEPQSKSRRITVEDVRGIENFIFQTSYCGGWKVCIIYSADRLTDQASNAFLKTLEEPPKKCLFLLVTANPHFFLQTIVSRCQKIVVSSSEEILEGEYAGELVEIMRDDNRISRTGRMAAMFDKLYDHAEEEEKALTDNSNLEEDEETIEARISGRYRAKRSSAMRMILLWYRDILLLVSGGDKRHIYYRDQQETLKKIAGGLNTRRALKNVQIVEEAYRQLERNMSDGIVLTAAFAKLA